MQDTYVFLGEVLSTECTTKFDKAHIKAELDSGFMDTEFSFLRNGEEQYFLPKAGVGSKVHDALHDLRDAMTLPGQEPWSKCTFTLFPDGQFKFDVEYDD